MSKSAAPPTPDGVAILGPISAGYDSILSPDALAFLAARERKFGQRRRDLLAYRIEVQAKIDDGWLPDFLPETKSVRDGDWTITSIPQDLMNRQVEIYRPGGPQDDHQRPQLRRQCLHGRFRGRHGPNLVLHDRGADQSARRHCQED
jgi:malate synthase